MLTIYIFTNKDNILQNHLYNCQSKLYLESVSQRPLYWGQNQEFTVQLHSFFMLYKCTSNIKNSKMPLSSSENMKAPVEVIHDSKYRHLVVLNSHSKRQTWACFTTWFAFAVNSETKSPSKKIVYILTGEEKHAACWQTLSQTRKKVVEVFQYFVYSLFLSL